MAPPGARPLHILLFVSDAQLAGIAADPAYAERWAAAERARVRALLDQAKANPVTPWEWETMREQAPEDPADPDGPWSPVGWAILGTCQATSTVLSPC
jgi:hypothetical protein